MRSGRWWPAAATLPAEALRAVHDPLGASVPLGPPQPADHVARHLLGLLAPSAAPRAAPAWLRPDQVLAFRRAASALDRFGGALLADPPGSGKSYIALAVVAVRAGPAVCLAPAALGRQWRTTAARLGVTLSVWSHERLSRGRVPPARPATIIVDESHWLRNPATRRYDALARWVGRTPTLLLSATPVVNRMADLHAQLALVVPDDALCHNGVSSLREALLSDVPQALEHLIITGRVDGLDYPVARRHTWRPPSGQGAWLAPLNQLRFAQHPPLARLLAGALWTAAGSSPAALAAALHRYRALLGHASDAARAGRRLDRRLLRSAVGADADQLVLWGLMPDGPLAGSFALDDADRLGPLLTEAQRRAEQPDAKARHLADLLQDGRRTLVFVTRRDTVRYLRRLIPGAAWCTGDRAGIGHITMMRDAVLAWFRPGPSSPTHDPRLNGRGPRVLLTTDVAGEGLDLQQAERVVHYDLPWTPVRLTQRDGRVLRRGSANPVAELITFRPPKAVERRLRQWGLLARKATLPARLGLGGDRRWRWRSDLSAAAEGPAHGGLAWLPDAPADGMLIGVEILAADSGHRLGAVVGWHGPTGWTVVSPAIREMLRFGMAQSGGPCCLPDADRDVRRAAATALRAVLRQASTYGLGGGAQPEERRAVAAMADLARRAVRCRDEKLLRWAERGAGMLRRGHTAGERLAFVDWLIDGARPYRLAIPEGRDSSGALITGRVAGVIVCGRAMVGARPTGP